MEKKELNNHCNLNTQALLLQLSKDLNKLFKNKNLK